MSHISLEYDDLTAPGDAWTTLPGDALGAVWTGPWLRVAAQTYRDRPSFVRLVLVGELDMAGSAALEAGTRALVALPRSPGAPLGEAHLDLEGLRFIDSTGLSRLLAARDSLAAAGWRVSFVHPAGQVERLLRMAARLGWMGRPTSTASTAA